MNSILHIFLVFFPYLVFVFLFTIVVVNVYRNIRRRYPVRVNCWFCNQWTRVSYNNSNSFTCPSCEQYNGFDKDGDYNKYFPEFSDELLNTQRAANNKTALSNSNNGLCQFCNNNQQLKIYQLANFVPLYRENYDIEIEHFQKQLEKAYKLCPKCDKVVKKTIQEQNSLLGLNISYLRKKGLIPTEFNNFYKLIEQPKLLWCLKIFQYTLVLVSLLETLIILSDVHLYKTIIMALEKLPHEYYNVKNILVDLIETDIPHFLSYNKALPIITRLPRKIFSVLKKENNYVLSAGVVLQLMVLTWKVKRSTTSLVILFGWISLIFLGFISTNHFQGQILKILISVTLTISYICDLWNKSEQKLTKKQTFKKLNKEKNNVSTFVQEDLDSSLNYSKKSKKSFLNNSFRGIQQLNTSNILKKSTSSEKQSIKESSLSKNSKNNTFSTFSPRSCSSSEFSFISTSSQLTKVGGTKSEDLNLSLDSLSLGSSGLSNKADRNSPFDFQYGSSINSFNMNSNVLRPKPIISPSKFQNPAQNSWVAGGFWGSEDFSTNFIASPSRCSSQSSGFYSRSGSTEKAYCQLPSVFNNSFSVSSEPNCNILNAKSYEFPKHGFNEWKSFSNSTRNPQGQLNITLGRRTEPVMITESLYRTVPNYPHFEHIYTNYFSGKPSESKGMFFSKNKTEHIYPDLSVANNLSTNLSKNFY